MSSSIFFRFKSQKEPLQITFDGASLSVFEVKRDIIALSKLGDGLDFDLDIFAADTGEKYDDDTTQVPRSSTVVAKRSPAARPGAGRAARYVTGRMPVSAKNAHRAEFGSNQSPNKTMPAVDGVIGGGKEMTEDERLQAMFQASDANWKAQQDAMSHKPFVRSFNKQAQVPDKPLPPGYTCHRCGEKGHWIQACPTNNDPNFDGRPKFKRTTGIPRSFLKVVEKPTLETGEDGKVDVSKLPAGVMYTANGEWVVAEPDKAAWDKFQETQKVSTERAKVAAAGDEELRERGLGCPIDKRMFVNPYKTPCCGKTYCFECIENALVEADLVCPNCGEQAIIDSLEADDVMVEKIAAYEEEKKAEKKHKEQDGSKSPAGTPNASSPKADGGNSPGSNDTLELKSSNTSANSAPSSPPSRKRAAEEELENDRKPTNPAADAMIRTNSTHGTPVADSPSSSGTPKPVQPPAAPAKDVVEFQKQMNAMAAGMPSMGNGAMPDMMSNMMPNMMPGMPNMPNMPNMMPNMFNPAMMGMPMMPPNMWNMGGMGGMPNMPNMPNMQNMPPMPGMPNMGNMFGNGNYGGYQQNYGGGFGNGMGGYQGVNGNGNDSAYMRQPVNPMRQRNRQNRPRSQDFRQV